MSTLQSKTKNANMLEELDSGKNVGSGMRSFLVQTCQLCQNEMMLGMGDIIYGEKWYHSSCWELIEEKALQR